MFRRLVNLFLGLLLVVDGFGGALNLFKFLENLPWSFRIIFLAFAVMFLAIDGFDEEHFLKYFSLAGAGILTIITVIPILSYSGMVEVEIPNLAWMIFSYLHIVCGGLLIAGGFLSGKGK